MSRMSGLELHGPARDGAAIKAVLLEAGEAYGLK
jgi:hypothetical protein